MSVRERVVALWGGSFFLLAIAHLVLEDNNRPVIWFHTFTGWLYLGVLPVFFWVRTWKEGVLPGLVIVLWLSFIWPSPGAGVSKGGRLLRVVSTNALHNNARMEDAVDSWLAARPDVVLIQEYSPTVASAMREHLASFPFRKIVARDDAFGTAVLSRWPIVSGGEEMLGPVPWIRVVLQVEDIQVSIWNVHTLPPLRTGAGEVWREQLDYITAEAERHTGRLVIAGDFNMTRHHAHYGALTAVVEDAYSRCGRWSAWTWPTEVLLPVFPKVKLDHLFLKGGIRCLSIEEGLNPGSDHRSIITTLEL